MHSKLSKMSLLDILCKWEESERIIKKYDEKAGECICCNSLFESIEDICVKYNLPKEKIIKELICLINKNQQ